MLPSFNIYILSNPHVSPTVPLFLPTCRLSRPKNLPFDNASSQEQPQLRLASTTILRKRTQDLHRLLREYKIEHHYGEHCTRLPLSIDGRLPSRTFIYFYHRENKGVSDPSLKDLASVPAVGSHSYKSGRYSRQSTRNHSSVQDVTTSLAHAQPLPT